MTLTLFNPVGSFYCKKCKILFEGEYKPQQRPRKSCPGCHKMAGLHVKKDIIEKTKSPPKTPLKTITNIKITMENAEDLIMDELSNNPSVAALRLMVEFLKIKQQDQSELQEIDLDIFYKKSLEEEIINE